MFEAAVEAGAGDVEADEEMAVFTCEPTELAAVNTALTQLGWVPSSSEIRWMPKETMELEGTARDEATAFLQAIDDNDDVHRVYTTLA